MSGSVGGARGAGPSRTAMHRCADGPDVPLEAAGGIEPPYGALQAPA